MFNNISQPSNDNEIDDIFDNDEVIILNRKDNSRPNEFTVHYLQIY
jgi:hypothetical protein